MHDNRKKVGQTNYLAFLLLPWAQEVPSSNLGAPTNLCFLFLITFGRLHLCCSPCEFLIGRSVVYGFINGDGLLMMLDPAGDEESCVSKVRIPQTVLERVHSRLSSKFVVG